MKVIRFDDKEFEILKTAIAAAQARYMLLQNDDPDNKQYMLRLRAFNNLWDKVLK